MAGLINERDTAVIRNLLPKFLRRKRARAHAFEIVERQLVQPTFVEALEKFVRRLNGEEGCKLRTGGKERK